MALSLMRLLLLILVVEVLATASFGGAFTVSATVLTDLLAPVAATARLGFSVAVLPSGHGLRRTGSRSRLR
jgi:hypothetical protein